MRDCNKSCGNYDKKLVINRVVYLQIPCCAC